MSRIVIVGIGPGDKADITPAAIAAITSSNAIVGYKYYFKFITSIVPTGTEFVDTGMKQERDRAKAAFELAMAGKNVAIISSGDAGIYGMAPLVYEMSLHCPASIEIEVVPGISAFQKAASLLGAPMGHDFCCISLSDLLTPWETIEKRITAAAAADFVTAVYNPKSQGRYWQLHRLKEIFMEYRSGNTPVGFVRQAGREGQTIKRTNLENFNPDDVDMFTVVIIGNAQTFEYAGKIITPRGYYSGIGTKEDKKVGMSIMNESFRTIERELKNKNIPVDTKWALLHAIHTTADFEMENLLHVDNNALKNIYSALTDGGIRTIVTDVTMAASGIRKGALERLGIEVKCYLHHPDTKEIAEKHGITRTQAGIRLAVQEHPEALYVFGNAPTALMELASLIRTGSARPCGIVAAPVGFVHVRESKHMIMPFTKIPKLVIRGRKGGSNLAATLTNAILCYPDAESLTPGRDV